MAKRWTFPILLIISIFQAVTHLFWLPIAAHSGQVAIPWMMNQGRVLFGNLLEQHAPGSSLIAAAAQRLLPFAPVDVAKLLNVLLVVVLTWLIFWTARRLTNGSALAGLSAALVWAWWEPVYGNVLFYFDTLMGFFLLLAFLNWLVTEEQTIVSLLLTGLLLGTATIMKQHTWAAVVLFLLWIIIFRRSVREGVFVALGAAIFPLITVGVIAQQGNLDTYIYWNWTFNLSGLMDGVPLDGNLFRKLLLTNILVPAFVLMALRPKAGVSRYVPHNPHWILLILLWGAGAVVLYPRFGEIHAMGHLPFMAIMSGIVIASVLESMGAIREGLQIFNPERLALIGLSAALIIGWAWTGAVSYVPLPVGLGATPAHTEYRELVDTLAKFQEPGDTLFILPEMDSTPQLHPLTGMLPPGTWIKGWYWYFEAPDVLSTLLLQWDIQPPTFVIVFEDFLSAGEPGINDLLLFVEDNYQEVARIENIFLHGNAIIYEYADRRPAFAMR